MRYRTRVAIQAAVEVRDPAGGVSHIYETIPELADVAATIVPAAEESRDPDLVAVEDRYDIVLAGHHPQVRPEMVVLDGHAVYDIVRVAPTLGRRETVLVAQRVALG
jgi:hypothetical protein